MPLGFADQYRRAVEFRHGTFGYCAGILSYTAVNALWRRTEDS